MYYATLLLLKWYWSEWNKITYLAWKKKHLNCFNGNLFQDTILKIFFNCKIKINSLFKFNPCHQMLAFVVKMVVFCVSSQHWSCSTYNKIYCIHLYLFIIKIPLKCFSWLRNMFKTSSWLALLYNLVFQWKYGVFYLF